MNTATLNIQTNPKLKAQEVTQKTISFPVKKTETKKELTTYAKEAITRAKKHRTEGKASPIFDNAKDAIAYLLKTHK